MRNHLFVDSTGMLYDTRDPNWVLRPLRPVFAQARRTIASTQDFKAALRYGASTDLGGYPLYLICDNGEPLCFPCAREPANLRRILTSIQDGQRDGWKVVGTDVNYEDGQMCCCNCGERMQSAYAEVA